VERHLHARLHQQQRERFDSGANFDMGTSKNQTPMMEMMSVKKLVR
jgi:hypothetical protein